MIVANRYHRFYPAAVLAIWFGLVLSGCRHARESSSAPKAENALARKLIGEAVPLHPIAGLSYDKLLSSMAYRRQVAWELIAQLTAPVRIRESVNQLPDKEQAIPLWRTWYEQGEILNMFDQLYFSMPDDAVAANRGLCEKDIRGAFAKLLGRDIADYGFSPRDYDRKLGQFHGQPDIEGIPGTGFTMFSPATVAHYFRNFREMIACSAPSADLAPPSATNHSTCMRSEFPDGRDHGGSNRETYDTDQSHCATKDLTDPAALGISVAVKANWFTAHDTAKIASFDTSAQGMRKMLNDGVATAVDVVDAKDHVFKDLYAVNITPNFADGSSRVAGLAAAHFTIKAFPDWMWITLWWSPQPEGDFGEDRPESIRGLWRNYKMCVVVDFRDSKESLDGNFRQQYPSLAAALDETYDNPNTNTGNSWCSNPFIERGKYNARTNCIGCHQHAGTGITSEEVFKGDEANFPHSGREKIRRNFVGDYLYSFDGSPDQFRHEFSEIVRGRVSTP